MSGSAAPTIGTMIFPVRAVVRFRRPRRPFLPKKRERADCGL